MLKCSRQVKSAIALLLVLAALIIPLYTVAPVNASAVHSFYGGAMPSNEGGAILQLAGSYSLSRFDGDIDINVTLGGVTIAYFHYYFVNNGGATSAFTVNPTVGYNNTLLAGQTYNIVYTARSGEMPYFTNLHVTYTPIWTVEFDVLGFDSSVISSNTILIVNGTSVPFSSFSSSAYLMKVTDGDTLSYSFSGTVNSTTSIKHFALTGTSPSSPQTIISGIIIAGTYLVYTDSSIYRTTIKGPYFEDGSVASNNSVTFSLLYVNGTTFTRTLNSSASVGSISITSLSAFSQLTWNATSVSSTFNATRVYTFANGQNGIDDSTVYLFILNPTKPAYQYTFSITDFYGMVNPYLQSALTPTGNGTQAVERVNLKDGGGFVTFVMQQYQLYTLTFICQQGTYSQTFTPTLLGAPGQNPVSLSILAGNFPSANITSGITYSANRTSSSTIMATYSDSSGNTTSINVHITHSQGTQTITDYSNTVSSSSGVFTWSQASANTNYNVVITAVANGVTATYYVAIPSVSASNPWAQVDWSNLGKYIPTLPQTYSGWGGLDPNQIMAVFLILAALGIGSYFSTGASCLICWVMAGILYAMGWWQCSLPMFAFAGVITVWILIDEYKKGAFNL